MESRKPKTVVFASHKGGVGKTTCAIHVSAALARRGYKVRLIDADPNASALNWYRLSQRNGHDLGIEVVHYLQNNFSTSPINVVLFDLRGRPEEEDLRSLAVADLFVIPVSPGKMDLEATKYTIEALQKLGIRNYRILQTRCPNQKQTDRVRHALTFSKFPTFDCAIREYQVFRTAAEEGNLCVNVRDRNSANAWKQVEEVTTEVINRWG
jgi:chromosome partitioning protein